MKRNIKNIFLLGFSIAMFFFLAFPVYAASGKIVVDGDDSDWADVSQQQGSDSNVSAWKICKDPDGRVYIVCTGTAVTQWDANAQWKTISFTNNGNSSTYQLANTSNHSYVNKANGNTPGPFVYEAEIPSDWISDSAFSVTFMGTTVNAADIPEIDGQAAEPEPDDGEYHGITIDGDYSDWKNVEMHDASSDGNLNSAAMVFDGDYVYLYLKENPGCYAANAGEGHNGRYEIATDLGNKLQFELTSDGTVNGVGGAESRHVGSEWEIAIPKSSLPAYHKTISFGLYHMADNDDHFVSDVANLDGSEGVSTEINSGDFKVDGDMSEWTNVPHSVIGYATPGVGESSVDGFGALIRNNETNVIYGHVKTSYTVHLNEWGNEFVNGYNIAINGDRNNVYWPSLYYVGDDGKMHAASGFRASEPGIYTFYIYDFYQHYDGQDAMTIPEKGLYGVMKVKIDENRKTDEAEYDIDLNKFAESYHLDPNDIKIFENQFIRIGNQWITVAGSSSGPIAGVLLCIGVTLAVLWFRKRRKKNAPKRQRLDLILGDAL